MDIESTRETIYKELSKYCKIYVLADTSHKIANLAFEEVQRIYVELVDKFDGLEFILSKFHESSDRMQIFLACFILVDQRDVGEELLKKIINKEGHQFSQSANTIIENLDEAYIEGYRKLLLKFRLEE